MQASQFLEAVKTSLAEVLLDIGTEILIMSSGSLLCDTTDISNNLGIYSGVVSDQDEKSPKTTCY